MRTRLMALLLTLFGASLWLPTASATPVPPDADSYLQAAVARWQQSPVYLDDEAGQLTPQDAEALAQRIDAWRGDIYVAILPAAAMSEYPGSTEPEQAVRFLDAAADTVDADGIYLVSFGGIGTYGAGYGEAEGAGDVGAIVADEVGDHTLGQSDQIFNGILDQLGAPGGESSFPWIWVVLAVVLVAVIIGFLALRSGATRRARKQVRASGEVWGGEADFRPSFDVQTDELETLEQRANLAREDVIRLGEELDASDLPAQNPAVAEHLQAALDAYAELSRRVEERTDSNTTEDELRHIDADLEYARWRFECAKAVLAGTPVPARRSDCFVDARHGLSVADVDWAPPGGSPRPIGVCRACFTRMTGERREDQRPPESSNEGTQ